MDAETDLLTLQQAATLVGCHYQTMYRRVRSGDIPALVVGGTYRLRRSDVAAWLVRRDAIAGAVAGRKERDWPRQSELMLKHLLGGDTDAARRQIDRLLGGGASAADCCDRLFAPALSEVGRLWREGQAAIADEHRAARAVEGLLERISAARSKPGPRLGTIVVATAAGDAHALAALMVATGLRAEGFTVHYLGAGLPAEEIVELAVRERADLVALSCCVPEHEGLRSAIAALAAAGYETIVGGRGIGRTEALALGGVDYGGSIGEAQRIARDRIRQLTAATDSVV